MSREYLGVAAWRWAAAGLGAASLAAAFIAERMGSPVLGTCLHPAARAALGHCPLCWTAAMGFATAAAPSLRIGRLIRSPAVR